MLLQFSAVAQPCPTLQPHGLQPIRLLCPWDSPGKSTAAGCHALLQGIFPTQGLKPGLLHCRRILCQLRQQGSHKGGIICICEVIIPSCASPSPAFLMIYSVYKLNKQGDNIEPWRAPFLIWNQSTVPCPVLTVASWPAYRFLRRQVRWSGIPISLRIFQFVVIHRVKGFGVVNKAEADVFLKFSCFFYDPTDAGNLFSGSSAFPKSSLSIWKFSVHILLKPSLENFDSLKFWWFYFLGGSKITADGDCSHENKRCLLLGRKVMTNLDSILKSRDITLPTKVCLVKVMDFPVVMYGCESWTVKRAERQRIDAFVLWC